MTGQITHARPFTGAALTQLLSPATRLLGLGEPTHGVDAFPQLRNELFRHLVEDKGYRSITIESDCLLALTADAYVTHGTPTLDDAMNHGFSHNFGTSPANRELLRWMRAYNQPRPPHERLHFYGFDAPLETHAAASPRHALTALHDYLTTHLDSTHLDPAWTRDTLDELLGPDEPWTNPAAMHDPTQSIGRTPNARQLRLITDDLHAILNAHAPALTTATSPDHWWRADLHARTAAALLRYHAGMADPTPARFTTLIALRDTTMADNLTATLRREARRGPTLAFAHNSHLQRHQSSMRFGGQTLHWWSAGAIMSTHLGDHYAHAATTFGTRGTDTPAPGTLEGLLATLPHPRAVIEPGPWLDDLKPRTPADYTYAALDPATARHIDAIAFINEI